MTTLAARHASRWRSSSQLEERTGAGAAFEPVACRPARRASTCGRDQPPQPGTFGDLHLQPRGHRSLPRRPPSACSSAPAGSAATQRVLHVAEALSPVCVQPLLAARPRRSPRVVRAARRHGDDRELRRRGAQRRRRRGRAVPGLAERRRRPRSTPVTVAGLAAGATHGRRSSAGRAARRGTRSTAVADSGERDQRAGRRRAHAVADLPDRLTRAPPPGPARGARYNWWSMKTEIHPQYDDGDRSLHVRQRVRDALHQAGAARRDLLELPSVLHGPPEADRHRRPRRALPAPRRPQPPARRRDKVGPRAWRGAGATRRSADRLCSKA